MLNNYNNFKYYAIESIIINCLNQIFGNIFQKSMIKDQTFQSNEYFNMYLPEPTLQLNRIFSQLKLYSKERLDGSQFNGQAIDRSQEIKGLKFIASKLATLFHKNRKLPYNQISKILIDNFASQQNDQRNIKRRVYDAINVLVAAGVLIKKNNFVQIIKNKIRFKSQNDKKDKIYDEIRQKQQILQYKRDQHKQLLRKHKLIKKLFDRNVKNSQKNQNSMTRSSKNRRKNADNQTRSLVPYKKQNPNSIIMSPKIFIKLDSTLIDVNRPYQSFIKQFKNENQIQLYIPYNSRFQIKPTNQGKQKPDIYMEEQSYNNFMNSNKDKDENQESKKIFDYLFEKDGPYSLIDLLQLLSLDQGSYQ